MHPVPAELVTLAPGHFHAALVFKEMLPHVASTTKLFAPFDSDTLTHLDRLRRFNDRPESPTAWHLHAVIGPAWQEQFRADTFGTVAIIAGQNRAKGPLIRAAVERGLHVLVDKPCIIDAADLPAFRDVLTLADERGLLVRDMMTERHEATTQRQRELIHDHALFGELVPGTLEEPALELTSSHALVKNVAGVPLVRPTWWYDPHIAGRGPADVGTHLADLAMWLLFPDRAITLADIAILETRQWPTLVPLATFHANKNSTTLPDTLQPLVQGDHLIYHGNGSITYRLCGHVVRWTVRWDVGPTPDTHTATVRGTRATLHVEDDHGHPEVYVERAGQRTHSAVNERTTHEAHFAAVLRDFLEQVHNHHARRAWETSNLLAKYAVTTQAGKPA